MRLKVKNGDLVRNIWTGEIFVVTDYRGYDYCKGTNTKGVEITLKRWDLEVYDGVNKWKGHKKGDWVE